MTQITFPKIKTISWKTISLVMLSLGIACAKDVTMVTLVKCSEVELGCQIANFLNVIKF